MRVFLLGSCIALILGLSYAITLKEIDEYHKKLNNLAYQELLKDPSYKPKLPQQALESRDIHKRSKRQATFFQNCPPGYTGAYCENPVCSNPQGIAFHDGMTGEGEIIFNGVSQRCGVADPENYTIPIDVYLTGQTTIRITSYADHAFPSTRLFTPNGTKIEPDYEITDDDGQSQTTGYVNLIRSYGAGQYRLSIYSIGNIPCSFAVLSQTTMAIDGGFVQNATDDKVQERYMTSEKGVERSPIVGVANWFAFSPHNLDEPGSANVITFYKGGNPVYTPYQVRTRYNCNAYDYAGPYVCTSTLGLYHLAVTGLDKTGNVWQRLYLYECTETGTPAPPVTAGTPTTNAPPAFCYNGGSLVKNGTECYCSQFFEGSQCQNKRCFHGGTLREGICECQVGYEGTFCEHVQCKNPHMGDFETRRAAMAFVIRGTTTMLPIWNDLYKSASSIIDTLNQAPGYIQKYVMVLFANGQILTVIENDDPQVFLKAVNNSQKFLVNATSCMDSTYLGISTALSTASFVAYKRSPIWVWTDALQNDGDDVRANLYGQIGHYRGQIFVSFPQIPNDQCKVDPHDPAYRDLRRLSGYSQGLVSRETSTDLRTLASYTAAIVRNAVHLATNDLLDQCSYVPNYQTFFVDDSFARVYVFAYGSKLGIVIRGPNRNVVNPDDNLQVGDTYIQMFNNLPKGNYLISVQSSATPSGPCAFRVIGNANTNAFIATAPSLTTDMATPYGYNPIYGQDNFMVAHLNNFNYSILEMNGLMAELTVWTNENVNGTRSMIYASNGFYRDSCDYHLVFGQWQCPKANLVFYASLSIEDGTGYIMQRVITGMCVTRQLCVNDCHGCQNGGVPNPADNSTCLCPPGYNGTMCQTIICQNGGTSNVYDCLCPDGWTGLFCEMPTCINSDSKTNFGANGKSLAFLVHNSLATRQVIANMYGTIQQVIHEVQQQHPSWINNYMLVSFTDKGTPSAYVTQDPKAFVKAFDSLYDNSQTNEEYSCQNLKVAEALYLTLKSPAITQYGVVYTFLTGLPKVNNDVLYEVNEMLQLSHVQVNFVQGSPMPCGASLSDFGMQILFNIAESTGGTTYIANPDFTSRAMRSIPSTYARSYLYQDFYHDCSNTSYFYFPVDSEVQTIQIQIFGDLDTDVSYISPDGGYFERNVLYNDVGSNARVDEILKPCDKGWHYYDHQCWYFGDFNQKTWPDAFNSCTQMHATLPILLSADAEKDFLSQIGNSSVWLGLNDMKKVGQWEWVQYGEHAIELDCKTNKGYCNWGTNITNATQNDPNRRCVLDQKYAHWQVENCATPHFYACVKHVYDPNNIFGSENANFLAPGMWTVKVKTYSDPDYPAPAPCEVKVFAQSGIRAFLGYSFNKHDDLDSYEPIQDSKGNYFVSHVTSISKSDLSMLKLQYAHFYVTDNMQMVGVKQFNKRDGGSCIWEYISTSFQCPTSNTSFTAFHPFLNPVQAGFQTALTGIDYNGNLFQRIRPTVCYVRNPLKTCENGGVYDKTAQMCICPPSFDGDRCEFPICYNDGHLDQDFFSCQCPYIPSGKGAQRIPLYSGAHCEYADCVRGKNNGLPLPLKLNKTFVLVLDGSRVGLMGDVYANLGKILNGTVHEIPGLFTSFVGVVVRDGSYSGNGSVVSNVIVKTVFKDFLAAIQTEVNTHPYDSNTTERLLLTGLYRIMIDHIALQYLQPESDVFFLSQGIAGDPQLEHDTQDKVAPYQLTVNFMYVGDTSPPGNVTNPGKDPRTRSMYELAYITGGGFYQVSNWSSTESFWYIAMAHRLNSFFIQSSVNYNCTSHVEYFQVAGSHQKILLDIYVANKVAIKLTNNNGSTVSATGLVHTNTNYLFSADISQPGIWKITIDQNIPNAGFCSVSIKGVDTKNQIAWGFTQDTLDNGAHTNDAVLYPDGRNSSLNAIIVNVPFGYATFAQIYDVFEKTLLWSSPFIERQRCTYNHITRDSFRSCPAEQFMLAIEGFDDSMNPYRRVGPVHCMHYHD